MSHDQTLLGALITALADAGKFNKAALAPPVAVLWTDAERQWADAVPLLREADTPILTLGDYAPDRLQGPAIWLKCALAGVLDGISLKGVPVLYLPGVSRADLRAIESCPRRLQPLAELQYRGALWTQVNARDWTINAFLTARKGGLGLDVAQDQATQKALLRALAAGELLNRNIAELVGRPIDAAWLDGLLAPNPIRDILQWMNNPARAQSSWQEAHWDVFASRCLKDYRFDPVKDGELVAAEKLAARRGPWAAVWELYRDAYASFPAVAELLGRVPYKTTGDLFADLSAYPKANEESEAALRYQLTAVAAMPAGQARKVLLEAEHQHGERRRWLWSKMGRAPLAMALQHLATVAEQTTSAPTGTTVDALAERYRTSGWQVDAAALKALAVVHTKADTEVIGAALRTVYLPWLEDLTLRFQQAVIVAGGLDATRPEAAADTGGLCLVFVDGLRYDVAVELQSRMEPLGPVQLGARWTSLPSVTASGKAWISPVASHLTGKPDDVDFEPNIAATLKPLNLHHFRKLLEESGYLPLAASETGDPAGKAWVECGDLDHFGHEHGLRLARDLDHQLAQIVERLHELAEAGWRRFRIVTDHGWLLAPGGLPRAELAKSQVETRWGRCAVLKDTATAATLAFGWDWCPQVQIAFAPGISSFIAGLEYAHGGLSLQECLVPVLTLELARTAPKVSVTIHQVTWRGLRCHVEAQPAVPGLRVDLRTKAAAADTSIVTAVKLLDGGKASLVVPDDTLEGTAAVVVILDAEGNLLTKLNTTVGE